MQKDFDTRKVGPVFHKSNVKSQEYSLVLHKTLTICVPHCWLQIIGKLFAFCDIPWNSGLAKADWFYTRIIFLFIQRK